LVLALESLKEVGSRLRGKLIVSEPDSDGTTSKVEPVHLLKGFSGLTGLTELNKSIATTAAIFIFLELDKLELAEGLKNILKISFRDTKVDIADV